MGESVSEFQHLAAPSNDDSNLVLVYETGDEVPQSVDPDERLAVDTDEDVSRQKTRFGEKSAVGKSGHTEPSHLAILDSGGEIGLAQDDRDLLLESRARHLAWERAPNPSRLSAPLRGLRFRPFGRSRGSRKKQAKLGIPSLQSNEPFRYLEKDVALELLAHADDLSAARFSSAHEGHGVCGVLGDDDPIENEIRALLGHGQKQRHPQDGARRGKNGCHGSLPARA